MNYISIIYIKTIINITILLNIFNLIFKFIIFLFNITKLEIDIILVK